MVPGHAHHPMPLPTPQVYEHGSRVMYVSEVEKGTLSGHGSLYLTLTLKPRGGGDEVTLLQETKIRCV